MTPQDIILHYVCPAAGSVIALFMFGAPLPAVQQVRRQRFLGEVNALPFAAMSTNSLAWMFYGFLIRDWFVYIPNMSGVMFGWYYTFSCYKFSKDKAQDTLLGLLLATAVLFFSIGTVHQAANLGFAGAKTLWGSTAVGVLAIYYMAPLSTILKVIKTRSSDSLNGPLCTMNVINGSLWFAYGLAIHDWFIAMPNGVGAALNIFCILLCLIFPKKRGIARDALMAIPAAAATENPLLRIQSAHFTPVPELGGPPARSRLGSFFDLAQFRWRSSSNGPSLTATGSMSATKSGSGWPLQRDPILEGSGDEERQQQDKVDAEGKNGKQQAESTDSDAIRVCAGIGADDEAGSSDAQSTGTARA